MLNRLRSLPLAVLIFALFVVPARGERAMTLVVDATDIERRLVHSEMRIPASPGELDLFFVEWTPGNHNPSGPIQNVVNFRIEDSAGEALHWRRDPTQVTRFTVDVPERSPHVTVRLSYICNQPAVNSRSTDSYGLPGYGGLNWNTVLVYPGGVDKGEFMVEATLRLPRGWRAATSLPRRDGAEMAGAAVEADEHRYRPATLARLIDSPVIFGRHLNSQRIPVEHDAPHYVHAVARSAELCELPEERLEKFAEMVRQSEKIFGDFPFSQYHILVILSDAITGFGVEQSESTFIGMGENAFVNAETPRGGPMTVVPHEYVHCWNAKLMAPEGIFHADYHTPALTQLMWVYEGLTSYYTDVVAVRCGLFTPEEFSHRLANRINTYELQAGRQWRSVEDTGAGLRHLRARSRSWEDLRRRQDYYSEGALFWMEADAIIRAGTGGERSLDDFCRAFFDAGPVPVGEPATYTRDTVIDTLNSVYDGHDWDAMVRTRIERPVGDLTIDLPGRLGYTLERKNEPVGEHASGEGDGHASLRNSIGLNASAEGEITSMVAGSAADRARLGYGMRIVAVNGKAYSGDTLREAVRMSPETGRIELLVNIDGETLETYTLRYDGGMRYPVLERDESKPDLLSLIARPL